jgi:hypothetical protein
MRKLRILAADAWYHVSTAVNNREPLFWDERERARFEQVLSEARDTEGRPRTDGGWLTPLRNPICPAVPPPHAANRTG